MILFDREKRWLYELLAIFTYDSLRTDPDSVVYFVSNTKDGPVKVGTTRSPSTRLRSLRTAWYEPIEVHGLVHGGRLLENHLHEELKKHKLSGEWFERRPALELLRVLRGPVVAHLLDALHAERPLTSDDGWSIVSRVSRTTWPYDEKEETDLRRVAECGSP